MTEFKKILFSILFVTLFTGLASAGPPVPVFVSVVPQKFFVQQIGKDLVAVQAMVKPGASPATYEPKPRQMAALSKAKIYFSIGVPFEKAWLGKIAAANPEMKVVPTDKGIQKLPMAAHHHHEDEDKGHHEHGHHEEGHHEEGHHGEEHGHHHDHDDAGHAKAGRDEAHHHSEGGLDPHIWLSPPLVKQQARTILAALQAVDPAHKSAYEANYQRFAENIDGLDNQLKQTFAARQGLQFMVFHPAWGYFADAYGLTQVPIEIEGKDPKPAQLQELIEHARASKINVIFVQPQFSTKSARQIAEAIHGQVVPADPLAEDWTANMQRVAEKFKAALR